MELRLILLREGSPLRLILLREGSPLKLILLREGSPLTEAVEGHNLVQQMEHHM